MRYGERLTHRWKGWLFTALAALLVASPGTAWSQASQVTDIAVRSVSVDDADSAGVVAEGTTSNVTVTLNKAVPVGDTVTVTIGVTYPGGGAAGATGNAEAGEVVVATSVLIPGGSSYGSTPVIFGLDTDAVDERFLITASALTIASNTTPASTVDATNLPLSTPGSGKIDDSEEQVYRFTTTTNASQIRENSTFNFTLMAVPARPVNENVTLHLAATRGYTIGGTNVTAAAGGVPANVGLTSAEAATGQEVTLTAPENDENRTDDTVTLTAHMGTVVRTTQVAMTEVTVLDIHQLPASDAITADARDNERRDLGTAIDSVMEGDTAYVWVAVINTARDRVDDAESFTVDVTGADPSQSLDYKITRPDNRRTTGSARGTDRVGPWVIEVYEDEDVGMENLMLSLDVDGTRDNGGGSTSGSFSLGIVDNTERKIWPLPEAEAYPAITDARDAAAGDDGLNPGESFTVMTSSLFGLMDGYTAAYAASVEGGAVSVSASGDSITVNAVAAGESTVTVTATARMAASAFQAEQTVSNVASIMFPVTVVEVEVPEPSPNVIEPKAQDEAYPVILGAIEAAEGDEGLNPGESFSLTASDLFTVDEGYTAAYAATVEGAAISASVSGATVTVNAVAAGEATVTITGTARAAASSFEASQTSTHTAEVKFPVTVVDKALVVTLALPANAAHGNVVEGQSYDIAVSANRAVHADTVVTIMRDRAESVAGDSDYTVGAATIMAGSDSATATLVVVDDNVSEGGTEDGGNVGESLVLFGVVNGEQTNDLTFTIWDVAVPALPFIATWLLGLGLLGGGARQMYLRRRQD